MGVDPASLAIKAGMMALQMGMTAMTKIKGPRLKSRDVTTADLGTPLERFWGKKRLLGRPVIHAEKLREKKTTSKTKGGKYAEYKYFGTFAVAVADHEIDSISRIWMDKHLCYDMTSAGPISALSGFFIGVNGSPVKLNHGRNMRIYLGTETQTPDPRYESWCEDRYGESGLAPALRGVAYIFFENIPLEKFGNRLPQIDVEAINNSNTNFLWDSEPMDGGSAFLSQSPDYTRFYADLSIWDAATRQRIFNIDFNPGCLGTAGEIWEITDHIGAGGGPFLWRYINDGQFRQGPFEVPHVANGVQAFDDGRAFITSESSTWAQWLNGGTVVAIDIDFLPREYIKDSESNVWVCGEKNATEEIFLLCVTGPRDGEMVGIQGSTAATPRVFINSQDQFVIVQSGDKYLIDNDLTLLDSTTDISGGTFSSAWGSDSLWQVGSLTAYEWSLKDLSLIRTLDASDWSGADSMAEAIYEPITHSLLSRPSGNLTWRFIDRVATPGVDLADVVSDVAEWCGIEEVDVTDLDQIVYGYSVVQGTGKDMIAPLLDIHDVDARPHDFGVQFLTRGNASLGTIPVTEFVREGDEPRYRITIAQDTDLPRQVSVSFADQDKDQQTNTVVSQRPLDAVDAVRTQQLDLTTYVGTPGDMQKLLDRYFRSQWNRREQVDNALTAQYLALEPADVYTIELDGVTWTGKAEKITLSQGRMIVEWKRDETGLHDLGSGTGAGLDARDDDVILVPSPTKGAVKDIPLVEDGHASDLPQLYYGAADYPNGTFWPGATIYEGDLDGDDYLPWKGVEPSDKMTWGYATTELGDCDPWCWDRGNSVNVTSNTALTTVTEAEIDADPTLNLALIGSELVNFVTATLEADGSYTLSGFKRGRRGTEWACADHAVGEEFEMVDTLAKDGLGLSDVGLTLFYKAETVGRDLSQAPAIEIDFAGNTLRPYAPASLKWTTDGTDLFGTIVRRTRIGGAWVGDSTIPLSENSEEYEVDILDGDDVVRTIAVSGTNAFTYTAAQISTDGFTAAIPPSSNVYQLSDAVGRGFALAA